MAVVSTIDGLCQLEMARGNILGARECLDQLASREIEGLSHQALWPRLSGARLELLAGDSMSADALAHDALKDAINVGDRELIVRLRLLIAEIAMRCGHLEKAIHELHSASIAHPDPSLEVLAEVNQVKGLLMQASGEADAAGVTLRRTRRVFAAIGHQRRAAGFLLEANDHAELAHAFMKEDSYVTLSRAAALFELGRADLVGSELLDLVGALGCSPERSTTRGEFRR